MIVFYSEKKFDEFNKELRTPFSLSTSVFRLSISGNLTKDLKPRTLLESVNKDLESDPSPVKEKYVSQGYKIKFTIILGEGRILTSTSNLEV